MTLTLEECLRRLEHRTALLQYLVDAAARPQHPPDQASLTRIADMCGDVVRFAHRVRLSLPAEAIEVVLRASASTHSQRPAAAARTGIVEPRRPYVKIAS